MKHLAILLFMGFSMTISYAQLAEDCVDALELVDQPTNLSDVPSITVDSLAGSGNEPAELRDIPVEECGPHGYSPKEIDKSFWIAFSAVTDGTLEFMIAPDNDGTDYDFALFEGFCPNDQCSDPIFCNYLPYLCLGTAKTGVSDDPMGTFGVDASQSFEIHDQAITLKAGFNYYLLIENRNEQGSICPDENPNAGFTIEFAGNAVIDKLIERPTIDPNFPTDTSQILTVCEGDILDFSVTRVPNAATYDWISKSIPDATFTYNAVGDSVSVQFGQISGQVCMEMICPIQSLICWQVDVDVLPDLEAVENLNTSCEPVDLNTRFTDNKGVNDAMVVFYETEEDAIAEMNPLDTNIVSITSNYWVRKTTPNGCFDIAIMTVLTESIEMAPIDTVRVCGTSFYDFTELNINSANGNTGNLNFIFYEDQVNAQNRTNPISPAIGFESGQYWVRAESQAGGSCFDVKPFEFVLETQPDISPIDTLKFCGCYDLIDLQLVEINGQSINNFDFAFYSTEAAANAGGFANTIAPTTICETGKFWLRASSSESCFDIEEINTVAYSSPEIDDVTMEIDCEFGCVDLSEQIFTEKNGLPQADLNYTYFTTEAEAEDLSATPIADLVICDSTEVWLRVSLDNGCFDVAKIRIEGIELATANILGDATICQTERAAINIDMQGVSPFDLVFTDGTTIFEVTSANNTYRDFIAPDSTATYTLVSVMDGNGCVGLVSGSSTVTVTPGVQVANISRDCNPTATEYTVIIELTGGDSTTYQVDGLSGNLVGNIFTSDPIPTGESYGYTLFDGSGCGGETQLPVVFTCECNSEVGLMDMQPIGVCEREPAIGFYLGGEQLDKEDVLIYVLHDSPDTTLGNILADSNVTIFTFDESIMEYGATYYLSAVITKQDGAGNPVLNKNNNPCLKTSMGTPVTFYPLPDITLSLANDSICLGEGMEVTFHIEGVGPFDVNFYDGEKITALMGIDSGHVAMINPPFSADIFVQTVNQSGVEDCRRDLMDFTANPLTVLQPPVIENFEFLCNKEASNLVIAFDLTGGEPGTYEVNGIRGTITDNRFVSDSIGTNTPYYIEVIDVNNCPPIILEGIAECFCTPDILVAIEVAQPISCRGEKDAILNVEPINGQAPFTYLWSTGETTTTVTNIAAEITSVTMTDGNGCEIVDSIFLEDPRSVTSSHNIVPVSCYGGGDGGILFVNTEGGTGDYSFSLDDGPFQRANLIENLSAGDYNIAVRDENGCTWLGETTVTEPTELDVQLGGNLVLNLGDSIALEPQINQEKTTVVWESVDPTICLDCPQQKVSPGESTRYKIIVTSESGCVTSDQVLVQVKNDRRVFVPNIFSPNGDGTNDVLAPYGSTEVMEISMFRIYNRWGELVYEQKDMPTEAGGGLGWRGKGKDGQKSPVGTYIYFAEVKFKDGNEDIITGDINLIR